MRHVCDFLVQRLLGRFDFCEWFTFCLDFLFSADRFRTPPPPVLSFREPGLVSTNDKNAWEVSQKSLFGPKIAARWLQDGPRWLQDWPRWPKDGPRQPKIAPRGPQDGPGWLQYGLKRAPRWPRMAPRWLQEGPKMAPGGGSSSKIFFCFAML